MDTQDIATLIQRSASMDSPSIYYLAPVGRRTSFVSQQNRALNLVWALQEKGRIRAGSRVAVIGAGVTGLTLAFALETIGCDIALFDPRSEPVSYLRNAYHRMVHPTINFWPETELNPTTSLPFLNWYAAPADRISHLLSEQFGSLHSASLHLNSSVRSILPEGDSVVLETYPDISGTRRFDIAICTDDGGSYAAIKVGDGSSPSYWQPDDLELQRDAGGQSFVVHGATDGGLIDTLRLAHRAFNKGRLAVLDDLTYRYEQGGKEPARDPICSFPVPAIESRFQLLEPIASIGKHRRVQALA